MIKVKFAAWLLATSLAASTALAQTPQTGGAPASRPAAPAATAPATPAPATPSPAAASTPKTPLVDINSASKEELDVLPGIGAARAEAIIKGRPYKSKDDLRRNKVLPSNVYQGIKDRIVARQS